MISEVYESVCDKLDGFYAVEREASVSEFDHPFAVQIFAIILGYVIVFRTNMALQRYRAGMSEVQTMVSKWGDAFVQINGFISANVGVKPDNERELEEFRNQMLHYFTFMDSLAITSLYGDEGLELDRFRFRKRGADDGTRSMTNILAANLTGSLSPSSSLRDRDEVVG